MEGAVHGEEAVIGSGRDNELHAAALVAVIYQVDRPQEHGFASVVSVVSIGLQPCNSSTISAQSSATSRLKPYMMHDVQLLHAATNSLKIEEGNPCDHCSCKIASA